MAVLRGLSQIGSLALIAFAAIGCASKRAEPTRPETPVAGTGAPASTLAGRVAVVPPLDVGERMDDDAGPPDLGPCHGGVLVRSGSVFVCDCSSAPQAGPFCDGELASDDDAGVADPIQRVRNVSTYNYTTCALMEDRTARCWGRNDHGDLGDGTRTTSPRPVRVQQLSQVQQLDVGLLHACAVIDDGTLRCWGNNSNYMLHDGSDNDRSIPVTARFLNDVIQVSVGATQTCVRHRDNTLECWVDPDPTGVLAGNGQTDVVDVEAGYYITAAWLSDGSVRSWGGHKLSGDLAEGTIKRVTSGYGFVCVLRDNGTVHCSGFPAGSGKIAGLSSVIDISAGFEHICALLQDGTLRCWGENGRGQVGDGSYDDRDTPSPVANLDHVVEVTCGREHSCARKDDGSVYCWGGNTYGQLGNGSTLDTSVPAAVRGL